MTFLARGVWGSLPMVTMSGPGLDDLLDFQADLAQVDVEVLEDVGGDAGAFLDQAQQDVLGADVLVVEALGLLVGQLHHLAGPVGKAFIHCLGISGCPGRACRGQAHRGKDLDYGKSQRRWWEGPAPPCRARLPRSLPASWSCWIPGDPTALLPPKLSRHSMVGGKTNQAARQRGRSQCACRSIELDVRTR